MGPISALALLALSAALPQDPATPGCHLYPFEVAVAVVARGGRWSCPARLSACVGFCESSAFPSRFSVLRASGYRHNVTSVAQCCTVSRLEKVRVPCGDDGDWVEAFTARSCQCDTCRLSRY
ncbi:glycoprotein hormone alpha-2-like [Lethenteron reissneri]|uniref:glycoprotein hormone alpha-2-like n=1 Tax=Lethenteron reissneri TaxID=7753 RepID=UPI002AB768BC|nr:glycoprotein hormone alpha-2-like [Lethenteron reissneri]XP_061429823.1 glycoprotein hormone alpha-2-like [Lethenteron reissneri]